MVTRKVEYMTRHLKNRWLYNSFLYRMANYALGYWHFVIIIFGKIIKSQEFVNPNKAS